MAKSLDMVVQKWQNNASAAQASFVAGVEATTVDPTALAAANEQGYLQGVQQAVQSGLWRRSLQAVGRAGWQAATVAKAGNYGTGISAGQAKYQQKMQTWLPIIQQAGAAAKQMPGGTLDQRIARSAFVARTLYNRKRNIG